MVWKYYFYNAINVFYFIPLRHNNYYEPLLLQIFKLVSIEHCAPVIRFHTYNWNLCSLVGFGEDDV